MSISNSRFRIDEIKKFLEDKIKSMRYELECLEFLLSILESNIVDYIISNVERYKLSIEVHPIRTSDGVHLADIQIQGTIIRIIPTIKIRVDTPQIKYFLINRILEPMRSQDLQLVRQGLIPEDKVLSYEVIEDKGFLREIIIKNVVDSKRIEEIKSAARWAFEKYYEKSRYSSV